MSTDGSTNNVTEFDTDMGDVLRARKASLPDVTKDAGNDYSGLVSGISVRSIQEIDHLIAGLQGLREKLAASEDVPACSIKRKSRHHPVIGTSKFLVQQKGGISVPC